MKENINQNIDENIKNGIPNIKKNDCKDKGNTSEDPLETNKKIVEIITENAVKDSKLLFVYFIYSFFHDLFCNR